MLAALLPAAVQLAPTATYPVRRCLWCPAADPHADRDGTLTITCRKPATRSGAVREDVDTYAVAEVARPVGDLRRWWVQNVADGTRYETVTHGRRAYTCTCPAGAHRRPCKHGDSLLSLMAAGALEIATEPAAAVA